MLVLARRLLRGSFLPACVVAGLALSAAAGSASAAVDLSARLIALPATYHYGTGNPPVYKLTVTNNGTDASNANPFYFYTNAPLRSIGGGQCSFTSRIILSNYGTCDIPSLAPGASVTKQFTAAVAFDPLANPLVASVDDDKATNGYFGAKVGDNSRCRATGSEIICPDPPQRVPVIDLF